VIINAANIPATLFGKHFHYAVITLQPKWPKM